MLRRVEDNKDISSGYWHKFNNTISDFDFKPKTVKRNEEEDYKLKMESKDGKTKNQSKILETEFDNEDNIDMISKDHKDETFEFKSVGRNRRDRLYTTKKN